MSKDFNNSRKSTRLQNWDYSWKGLYFVTCNTKFGENYFGEISDGENSLNDIGQEVERQWLLTPSIRSDMNLILDEFIVMPNHFHGIIGINSNEFNAFLPSMISLTELTLKKSTNADQLIEFEDLIQKPNQNTFGPQRKNLGSIMRGFKSSISAWCRKNNKLFEWHTKFHDVRIKDDFMLHKIRKYIQNNPKNWNRDRFNK